MKTFLKLFNLILVCVNFSCSNIIQRITETFDIPSLKVREIVHGSIETIAVQKKGETERRLGFEESVLLCIGFIRRDKGYEYAIRALSHLGKNRKKIRMIIAGIPITPDGWNYLAALKDLVKKLHLSNDVIFDTRYIPEEDMTKYFSSSDVILLPYSRRVGPSGPLAMAASFGLPTIMTSDEKFASSNVSAFVKLVPPRNSMALACAIQELLENEETMSKMVGDAVAYASKYSYGEVARQHLSLYFFTMKARGYLRRNS